MEFYTPLYVRSSQWKHCCTLGSDGWMFSLSTGCWSSSQSTYGSQTWCGCSIWMSSVAVLPSCTVKFALLIVISSSPSYASQVSVSIPFFYGKRNNALNLLLLLQQRRMPKMGECLHHFLREQSVSTSVSLPTCLP